MILVHLNVLLDVVQKREPHYHASAALLEEVIRPRNQGALPAHAVTTLHYIVGRYQTRDIADNAVDWLLRYFHVSPVGREELLRARALAFEDFEDAVVAAAAESAGCTAIVTRNVKDFQGAPVEAVTPEEYLVNVQGEGGT